MIGKLIQSTLEKRAKAGVGSAREQGVRWAVSGAAALLGGQKLPALGMFARGVALLEKQWREEHPDVAPGLRARLDAALDFYEAHHQNPTNRTLHVIGIPMVVGGTVGLLAAPSFTPPWWIAAGLFVVGWQLNIAGHVFFEKNRPAFAEDPVAFIAGPVWDAKQLVQRLRGKRAEPTPVPA